MSSKGKEKSNPQKKEAKPKKNKEIKNLKKPKE
jgi:hypothetical protein